MSCFYQIFGAERVRVDGWGDCSICLPDEKNGKCKGFFPINIQIFEVKGGDENVIHRTNKMDDRMATAGDFS